MSLNRLNCTLLLLCLSAAAAISAAGEEVKRVVAVASEQDHPQVVLLVRSLEAELVNLDQIILTHVPEASDAVLYIGRLELGSRQSLWVRGMDRYFNTEVFTETYIFQRLDTKALIDSFLPTVVEAVRKGFPSLKGEPADLRGRVNKVPLSFPDPAGIQKPVTLRLTLPPGGRLMLRGEALAVGEDGTVIVRGLPGALLSYRAEAPGYVPEDGEILIGNEDEARLLEMSPYALWALELKARLWEMGAIPGIIRYLLDEEIFLYASLEQNVVTLKNIFGLWDESSTGFWQPVIGMGGYSGAADALLRPYMGFGFVTRFVFGETRGIYLSKTMTAGIDLSLGLDIDPFEGESLSLILNYTPRIFYSSFYERPFDDYFVTESPPAHLEGHWFLQWAGPFNIGVRWEL